MAHIPGREMASEGGYGHDQSFFAHGVGLKRLGEHREEGKKSTGEIHTANSAIKVLYRDI